MKAYIVSERQMQSLLDRLEIAHMRANNLLTQHDPVMIENNDVFHACNFVVQSWIHEVGRS